MAIKLSDLQKISCTSGRRSVCPVANFFGVIQGSTLGSALYDIFIDSLLRKITFPSQAFAGLKFIADIITHSKDTIQNEINIVVDWAYERGIPLSIEKCCFTLWPITALQCLSYQIHYNQSDRHHF